MSDKRRTWLLIGLLAVVAIANIVVRLGEDRFDPGAWNRDGLETNIPASLRRTVDDLETAPTLSFRNDKQALEARSEDARNPFIFGKDQRLEAERRREMEALAAEREALAAAEYEAQATIPAEDPKPGFPGRILGVMESRRGGKAVSVMIEQEVKIFRQGDVIGDMFRLENIGYQTVRVIRLEDGQAMDLSLETN